MLTRIQSSPCWQEKVKHFIINNCKYLEILCKYDRDISRNKKKDMTDEYLEMSLASYLKHQNVSKLIVT